jgi:hypothetical protein
MWPKCEAKHIDKQVKYRHNIFLGAFRKNETKNKSWEELISFFTFSTY